MRIQSRWPLVSILHAALLTLLCALSVLCFVHFEGNLPSTGLDPSWIYVVSDAANGGKVFGRDIVFTSGPLAPLYTRFFVPDGQIVYAALSTILVTVFCAALWLSTVPPRRYIAFVLPLILANLILLDAFFLTMPIAIIMLARRVRLDSRAEMSFLAIAITALGIWPLVKGTFAIPGAVGIITGITILYLRGRRNAIFLLPLPALLTVACWKLVGQPLNGLPDYVRRGTAIAAGYTDAMSVFDHTLQAVPFIVGAACLLLAQWKRERLPELLAYSCILFVAFKAAFVREHLIIGGTVLLMTSLMLILERVDRLSVFSACLSTVAAFHLCSYEEEVRPDLAVSRFRSTLSSSIEALLQMVDDPSRFRRAFDLKKSKIAENADLPPTSGPVDLYSADQTLLLASGRDYVPRPIFQSYSAYTPELLSFNRAHLQGAHAPRTIFFAPQPIDDRYPAIEDGPSWPDLLSRYEVKGFYRSYVVLEHLDKAHGYMIDPPVVSRRARFGEKVEVPDLPLVWASLKFDSSLIGRLAKIIWKTPPLLMELTYQDGHSATFRVIPGMTSSGFLLSPTVETAGDFVALRSEPPSAHSRVRAIALHQLGGFLFSRSSFDLDFSALQLPPLAGKAAPPLDAMMPVGGECAIEMVGGKPAAIGDSIRLSRQPFAVKGWATPYKSTDKLGRLRLALQSTRGGTPIYSNMSPERVPRPDIDAALQLDHHLPTGFATTFNLENPTGTFDLRVVQEFGGTSRLCPNKVRVEIGKTP